LSTKTVADRLLIKPNTTVWTTNPEHLTLIEGLPDSAQVVEGPAAATTALIFASDAASLRSTLTEHQDDLTKPTTFWVAYPKGNRADINRDSLWPIVAEYGMRPIGQVAVDEVWSALRFRPLKEGEAQFTGGR
jgi:hypothetical protein